MKILFNSVLMIVAAGGGLALGFALRGKTVFNTGGLPADKSPPATASEVRRSRVSNPAALVRITDDSPLATQLERDLSMSSGVTRWLYWLEAIEKAVPADFPRLLRLAQGNAAATRLVSDRWIELYPRQVFDTIVATLKKGETFGARELANQLFEEWPRRDPDAAIAALNESDDFGSRGIWRHTVAGAVIRKDPERGLRLFGDWHIENFGPHMDGIAKWAAADPRHAAEFALENPSGYVSQLTMETIGKEWATTDPARALEFAVGNPGELGTALAGAALKQWAGRNLNEAADWLARADVRTRNRLSPPFVEAWAKTDANEALAWCESSLSGSSLAQAVGGVVKGAAEKDVAAAAALVTTLEPSPARAEAAVAVARKWFPELSAGEAVKPETIAWLGSLDGDSVKRVLDKVQWGWATSDPKSMADFLAKCSSTQVPASAHTILARELARKNPLEAIEWADGLPQDRRLAAGGEAFAEWRRSQPDAATKWLNDLPPGDPRRLPYFQSAVRVLAWDLQAAEQLATLTASERAAARSVIETMSLSEERRANLLAVLK